ncbi:NADH-quinone oxidoreductase subunit NuoE [Calderihabitans maritimus]|uniref:NADH dehydrogenase subunit E n=1 Tax=Calderihabitans maritimus TaxID=1246530 RepID=A0A1Z5HRB8_9FIRM|nr:NADH-quinone oxidoreductase subunit NuoE [Calderihabitans maritimus]GAW91988.1 NADH dehydrogenase subunit E [Calderihabitans maritimus]
MGCTNRCEEKLEKKFPKADEAVDLSLLEPVLEKYAQSPGSLITILQKAQDIYNYLPVEVLKFIAARTGVKPATVYGVATFYTQFRLTPVGKHVILLCQGTACHVNGSENIMTALCDELKIKEGETTPDGMFTLQNVACLGCCSLAPVMMIDGETYGELTPDKARQIIRGISKQEQGA